MARVSKVISALLLALLGAIFLSAGGIKAADPAAFASDIDRYQLLPWSGAALLALFLPWLELVCGGAVFFRKTREASLWLLLAMTGFFLAALLSAWHRGLDVRCGCFGEASETIPVSLLRDVGIFVGILWLIRRCSALSPR